MNKKEAKTFMERIKSHYQEFIIDEFKFNEWYEELKKYDAEDVNKKFEEHLKSEVYGEYIPKLYFLTKYLVPTADKGKVTHYYVNCQLCGQAVFDDDYDKHYRRCSSATTIVRDLKQYCNKDVDYQKIIDLDEDTFEKIYQKYLDLMLDAPIPDFRKKIIMKIKYPEMEMDEISDLVKQMVAK